MTVATLPTGQRKAHTGEPRTGNVERGRLAWAVWLDVQQVAPGEHHVIGQRMHVVTDSGCDCVDHQWRNVTCKHMLAVGLYQGNREVIRALRQLIPEPRQ